MIFVKNSRGVRREGGQHDQLCVKNRVGGRGVNNVFKYTVSFFYVSP